MLFIHIIRINIIVMHKIYNHINWYFLFFVLLHGEIFLEFPMLFKCKQESRCYKMTYSMYFFAHTDRSNSYESLSSSAIDLQEVSEDETLFWQSLVTNSIGAGVNPGLSSEQRTKGLRSLRNRALVGYLTVNMVWVAVLTGFYAFLTKFFTDKLVYGVIVLSLLGVSAIIQILGMTVYRCSDMLTRFGRLIT